MTKRDRSGRGSVRSARRSEEAHAYIIQDGEEFVLVPVNEYERLIKAEMTHEAVAQIDQGDDELVDADQFFLELAGEWVAKARKAKKLTQAQLAKKLGVPQSQISRIERNPDHTTMRTLKRVAKALGVDIRAMIPKRPA